MSEFSAMISPSLFEKIDLPVLQREADFRAADEFLSYTGKWIKK